ncbi:hypothetical protein D9757_015138 [Collybiopsis confluens]|uniref:Branched-chain-amino-acid aminotransferase n=1 Tax=Collybiopsis confluens TaxID=2823264 RepID=A0A8H5CG67_9AGAR|nr:hypothetical protein D9757_015138 [Collybiopsis confluens]
MGRQRPSGIFRPPLIADLDPSKLIITLTDSPKPLPNPENLVFGTTMSDHMLVASFDPVDGWSAPEIKPYGPLSLDPASTCFQYAANIFEGMKAHLRPDGTPILFRPEMNVARLGRSADRLALPPFNPNALLELIRKLVALDKTWIPTAAGCSLYIRPTLIGTRPGVGASDRALLYVILSPSGPYFRKGPTSISLLAATQNVRAWPGGTAGNYAPGFLPQLEAAKLGYDQVLWLLKETGEDAKKKGGWRVTEAGAMNIFVVLSREDGDLDIVTPSLDGTILPGVTRDSVLHLCKAHTDKSKKLSLPGIPPPKSSTRTKSHSPSLTCSTGLLNTDYSKRSR